VEHAFEKILSVCKEEVDTNAMIVFIKNEKPQEHFAWFKVEKRGNELLDLVKNGFTGHNAEAIFFRKGHCRKG
jgi:hypothetical protein